MGQTASTWRVLITDYNYPDLDIERAALKPWNAEVTDAQCVRPEDVVHAGREADALISQYASISQQVLAELRRCKVVARYGIGVDNIDVPAATRQGIAVVNVPSYCEDEVSDHALAMLLAWARRVPHYADEVRRGTWDWKTGRPIRRLKGQVLGCLGFGKIARTLADKAQALGLTVIAHDPYVPSGAFAAAEVESVDFDTLLERSDFLSVHIPLTEDTRHRMSASAMERMKPTACVINTSRGPVIDEQALAEALRSGRLAGACLDVLEDEPPKAGSPLLAMDNVLISPHVAWYSEESQADLRRKVADDVGRALNGVLPNGLVNRDLAHQFRAS